MLRSDATRYLSAGTYLDAEFRGAVLDELLGRKDRAVAPAFSTDAVPVVRHALNARRHQLVRDAALTGVLLLFLVIEARLLLGVLALIGALWLAWRAARSMLHLQVARAVFLLVAAVIGLIVALVLLESGSGLFSSFNGSSGYDETLSFGSWLRQVGSVLIVVLGTAWTAIVVEHLINRQTILDHLMPGTFVPGLSPTEPRKHQARIGYIGQAQTGNVTYYPADAAEHPFVGAGPVQRTWTQVVPLGAAGAAAPLSSETLRDALARSLAALNERDPENEVSVQDRLVSTAAVRSDDPRTEPSGLLRHRLLPEQMDRLAGTDADRYLSVRMAPRRGGHEIWVFIRCEVQAQTLHLDLVACGLPPVRGRYREIDQYAGSERGVVLRTALNALPQVPGLLLRAPLRLLLSLTGREYGTWNWRQIAGTAPAGRGARSSVRELGTDTGSGDLMAGMAVQRHIRLLEQEVLDTIAATMERSGLNTEEFRRRTQNISDGPAR